MLDHIAIALATQLGLKSLTGSWRAGTAAACAWAIAREITQAEYRWIETFGEGRRANMPWWGGLDLRVWGYVDPWLDWIVPCAAVVGVALIGRWRRRVVVKDARTRGVLPPL